jgi:hypothetical protein
MLPNVRRQRQGVAFPERCLTIRLLTWTTYPSLSCGLGVAVGLTGMRHPVIGTTV